MSHNCLVTSCCCCCEHEPGVVPMPSGMNFNFEIDLTKKKGSSPGTSALTTRTCGKDQDSSRDVGRSELHVQTPAFMILFPTIFLGAVDL